jgi:drug/metabolite transporter (DMT)-like permease
MKWLKIALLLTLVLAAMRATSWVIAGLLRRCGMAPVPSAVAASVTGLALFAGLLAWNLLPGEPMDWNAVLFGAAVFGACGVIDARRGHRAL